MIMKRCDAQGGKGRGVSNGNMGKGGKGKGQRLLAGNAPQRPTTPHNAPQRPTTPHNAPQRPTTPHNAPQRSITLHNAPQRPTTPHNAPQRSITLQEPSLAVCISAFTRCPSPSPQHLPISCRCCSFMVFAVPPCSLSAPGCLQLLLSIRVCFDRTTCLLRSNR
jgi:hypothetical protein